MHIVNIMETLDSGGMGRAHLSNDNRNIIQTMKIKQISISINIIIK